MQLVPTRVHKATTYGGCVQLIKHGVVDPGVSGGRFRKGISSGERRNHSAGRGGAWNHAADEYRQFLQRHNGAYLEENFLPPDADVVRYRHQARARRLLLRARDRAGRGGLHAPADGVRQSRCQTNPVETFRIILHRSPEPASPDVWGERLNGVLRALREHVRVERVLRWESRTAVREVSPEPSSLADYLRSRPVSVDDAGVPHPEAGIVTALEGVAMGDRDEESLCEISLSTGERGPTPNYCNVRFWRSLPPDPMPRLFADCVEAFSPTWAGVESDANMEERLDEEEAGAQPVLVHEMLHWCTYFAADRVPTMLLARVRGRDDVIVRELHEGVEVVLGERWESNQALRRRQRELEPLLFDRRAAS